MINAFGHYDTTRGLPHIQPLRSRLRRMRRPVLQALLVAAAGAIVWLSRSTNGTGAGEGVLSSAGTWLSKPQPLLPRAICDGRDEHPSTTEASSRCKLTIRLPMSDGRTFAAVECNYERVLRMPPSATTDAPERATASHPRWVWLVCALVPILLACVLVPEPEQPINSRRPKP